MSDSHDKDRLDALREQFKAQPVGWGYIDIIVSRENYKAFAKALVENAFTIRAISWWEYIADVQTANTYGLGGPTSRYYAGWFAETCTDLDDVPHTEDPQRAFQAVVQIIENKVLGEYDGKQISFQNTPSLTPAFWLNVDDTWRNTQ